MSYIICISIIVRHINQIKSNQIKSSLPIYLVKCHPSIELLRVKWEENYLRFYVVAMGKEWQCLLQLSWDQAPPPFPLPRLHLSARFARRFYFPFPFNEEPGPGLFCNYLMMTEFETDFIRQSSNKIVINGDVILVVFPPFQGTEE